MFAHIQRRKNTTLGGYYKIDMSNRKVELLGINTALYLENNMATRHNYHHDPGNPLSVRAK